MKSITVNNLPHLSTVLCAVMLLLSLSACSDGVNSANSAVSNAALLSSDIKAVVYIESPKVGTLLQLRGIAGKGVLVSRGDIIRQPDNSRCTSVPIRFAAGDFGGADIGIHSIDPIRLAIYSDKAAKRLIAGDEVVSDDYEVADQSDARLGDIKIESGLTLSYGFVLNPGEWSWSSLFGQDQEEIDCGGLMEALEVRSAQA